MPMQPGDTVRVRASGRRARIVEQLSHDRYVVEFLPDPAGDPLDRDTVQSEDEAGIYRAVDLELLE
jgi:hypothetical protein